MASGILGGPTWQIYQQISFAKKLLRRPRGIQIAAFSRNLAVFPPIAGENYNLASWSDPIPNGQRQNAD